MLKKFIAHSLVFSLVFNNLAFATQSIIELDFKDSQTPQRLHTILPSYKIEDVSHVEIDADKQQVMVHRLNKTDELQQDNDIVPVSPVTTPVILHKWNVQNLPWDQLLQEGMLQSFLLNHTAWLSPLDEDGYKLEFRGALFGGMKKSGGGTYPHTITITPDCNNPALGWSKTEICQKYKLNPPMAPANTFLAMRHDDVHWMQSFAEEARYQSQMMIYNSQLISHNAQVDKLLKEENDKLEQQRKELKQKEEKEDRESSLAGSSLFENVPSQYQVTPEYFEKSASDAGMRPSQALNIILNPTSNNFYDRTILTSRQNWLGGSENTTAFGFEDLTNQQAYKYISQGYKPQDFITLSDRLVSQNGATLFENVKPEDFLKQAEKANMTSIQALGILVNPTPENFYDRIILASRQNWLGGAKDTTAFLLEGLTNEEAYKYISQGYHKGDTATISNKLISERWDIDTGNPFDDQVLENWGVKDRKEDVLQVIYKGIPNLKDMIGLGGKFGGGGVGNLRGIQNFKNVPPVLQRQPNFQWTVKEPNVVDKVGRHSTFGNIYKDPTQKVGKKEVFWMKDNAKHGGSEYKLFEETSEGLKWIADIDKAGKVIFKHKSQTGMFIPKKEIIGK